MSGEHCPILVAGMAQSGSTLLYNIILNILDLQGFSKGYRGGLAPVDIAHVIDQGQYSLSKAHDKTEKCIQFLQHKNIKVFTARRDLRDACASHVRKLKKRGLFKLGSNLSGRARHYLECYLDWEDRSDFEFIYEKYKNGDEKRQNLIIRDIAQILNFKLEEKDAAHILYLVEEVLPSEAQYYIEEVDSNTLMTKYHITNKGKVGGYKDSLTLDEIKEIESACGSWLREKGYMK